MKRINLNLDGYDKCSIGVEKGDYLGDWCKVEIDIKNSYFCYYEKGEMLLGNELEELYDCITKCLNNELKEDKELSFLEPDLSFLFYRSEDDVHLANFMIELNINNEGYNGDVYSMLFSDEQLVMIRDYIKKLLKL